MNKKTLLTLTMCKEGFYYQDLFGGTHRVDGYANLPELDFIPEQNLELLNSNFDLITSKCKKKSYGVFLSEAAKLGLLKFKPYVTTNSGGSPMLVLKYNRYVHLFRGYYYQCSYTPDAHGEYSSGGVRLDRLTHLFRKSDIQGSILHELLYYINLIMCCAELDVFHELLEESPEVVDEFMKLSTKGIFSKYSTTFNDVIFRLSNIHVTDDDYSNLYRVPASDTMDYCRVKLYSSQCVGIERMIEGMPVETQVWLPSWDEGLDMKQLEEDYEEDELNCLGDEVYNSRELLHSLVGFALVSCGYVTNYLVTYPRVKPEVCLKAINAEHVEEFKNLGSLDSYKPIEK